MSYKVNLDFVTGKITINDKEIGMGEFTPNNELEFSIKSVVDKFYTPPNTKQIEINFNEVKKVEGRDVIPVCSVHDRFQTENGRWLDVKEDFTNHVIYTHSQKSPILESPCDLCD